MVIGIEGDKIFVQDFGNGMSPKFMKSIDAGYCTIGYSTKRERQDQIGYYGFGRLVNLSYVKETTKQYWVNTVYKGVAYQYLIFLDGNTIKQTLLSQEQTTEPSGTRVSVQINKNWGEIDKWKRAVERQAAYFENTIVSIDGVNTKIEVTKNTLLHSNFSQAKLHFVLGCVYYEIDWNQFPTYSFLSDMKGGIFIGLDEGIVPTPSRESLLLNNESIQILNNKFYNICESLYKDCQNVIEELENKSDIKILEFVGNRIIGQITINNYKNICALLGKQNELVFNPLYAGNEGTIWRSIRGSFVVTGRSDLIIYHNNWTKLKIDYYNEYFACSIAKKSSKTYDLTYYLKLNLPTSTAEEKKIKEQEVDKIAKRLEEEYIKEYFTPFDEVGFEQWKKGRKSSIKKERGKGITYYRNHIVDNRFCTEDKGNLNLSKYPCLFKATKETAQKYWTFLNRIYKDKLMITKSEGYDLDKLEPSPFLKRMCTEALKSKVYSIVGGTIKSNSVLDFIGQLNPLLHEFVMDTNVHKVTDSSFSDTQKALVEVGETFGCFDKDEMKLKYIEHHFNKLKLLRILGGNKGYLTDYEWKYSEEEQQIIKRVYTLERLVEKKQREPIVEDVNQLQLELN